MFKKMLLSVLVLALLLAPAAFALSPGEVAEEILGYYNENNTDLEFWDMAALFSAGIDISNGDFQFYIEEPSGNMPTDYAKYIFYMLMQSESYEDINDENGFIEQLAAKQSNNGGFSLSANQHIWAMLALDAVGARYNRVAALSFLESFQNNGGGFSLDQNDGSPYIDVTAMALTALSQYDSQMTAKAVEYIKNKWQDSDVIDNANTISVVISGLCAVGENILSSKWLKDGESLFDYLCEFMLDDGSFEYMADDNETNRLATAQALIAINDMINENSVWCRFATLKTATASLRIEGIESALFSGDVTVISAKPTVLDAIVAVLESIDIDYTIKEFYGSHYISSINDETEGQFGGYEGWLYIVDGNEPSVGMGDFELESNEEILLYYGGYAPDTLIAEYSISPSVLRAEKDIKITLTASYFDWAANAEKTVPIEGAKVVVNKKTYLTDESGVATINDITKAGSYKVNISKMNDAGYPAIVRILEFEIEVEKAEETTTSSNRVSGGGTLYLPPAPVENTDEQPENTQDDTKQTEDEEKPTPYSDSNQISDWATSYIEKAQKHKIMVGNDNNEFLPQAEITRAEFTALLIRLLDMPQTEEIALFDDISPDEWYFEYVSTAKTYGIISGYDDNTFRPNSGITREEVAVIISRSFSMEESEMVFDDSSEISDWASKAVSRVASVGIMQGSGERFEPKNNVTREMAAVIAIRLFESNFERVIQK
ncbi:MAG: S-layer homology domain-containing protein [Firmicutes bacterium]|nr:S-layer homology domain-containing protein [Bacillota bacterium]